ncbi:glycoside hydrolase family 73 protein [Enterococcus pseudoavium]|uniref:glycoside hydrolase family 73 protein n=1 Tax=Enterococcus pseudoavium TaxID=44007 RepID=UPI002891D2E8|nr:glycoside hydrolase family 73 protein [Enterococcus pseudoavium]MDT2753696.1 glycoside hydrolase family 73 protein [Enterococcus pseudoavium]
MDLKRVLYSVIALGSIGVSIIEVDAETVDSTEMRGSLIVPETTAESTATVVSNELIEANDQSQEVDETEYDALGNLQFHHPIRYEDFTIEPPTARFSRASANTQHVFINQTAPLAKNLANANDLYASVMIAQAIVESGWGSSALSKAPNYNLFGIKGNYNGQSVTMPTWEYSNKDGWYEIMAKFRKYPSFKESLNDNVTILKKTSFSPGVYYYSGAWKSKTKSYKDATAWLTGRYATAPTYASTLNNVIETYDLTQFDTGKGGDATPAPVKTEAMYRLYNPNSGEHFYTASAVERDRVRKAGWHYEGVGWQAPKNGTPVYRLYNPNAGDHHYTPQVSEKNHLVNVGWRYEEISWYSGGSQPLYRLYNPNAKAGSHHYTLLQSERNNLIKQGWRNEGIGWYGQ